MTKIERKSFITDEHLKYLDILRGFGATNMFGAASYILSEFPELTKQQARDVLLYWMDSFKERHK